MNRAVWIAGAGAFATAFPLPSSSQTNTVRIAITANDASAEPIYAQGLGYFSAAGIDAQFGPMANGGAIVSGLVSGAVDIGISNVISAVAAFSNGIPIRIVASAAIYDGSVPQLALLVAKSSPITSAKDLEGKTIATNPLRGSGDLALGAWMQNHGADPTTVKWLELPLASMGSAIAQGRIDGATVTEPFIALNRATTRVVAAPYSAIGSHFATIAWIASGAWVQSHPELVSTFRSVMSKTAAWANRNQAKSGAMLAAYSKMDPHIVAEMSRVRYAETLKTSDIQPNIDISAKYKRIATTFRAQDMIYKPDR